MAERLTGLNLKIFIAVMAIAWALPVWSAWQMGVTFSNAGTGGASISSTAYLGENSNASNTWDWNYDVPLGPPPNNPGYVRIYFPHTDFGANNGNYLVDIRAATPVQKTWNITLSVNTPLSTSYSLSWSIPPLLPDYYRPKLLIGSSTIDMRNQSSHAWTGFVSSCSVRLDMVAGMPYLLAIPPDLEFSDNLPQALNLKRYFAVLSGNLSFSFSPNSNLTQSLVTIGDSLYWQCNPVHGYVGSTSSTLSAIGSGGTKTATIGITRSATNSPPSFRNPPGELSVIQNQSAYLSWADQISDPDLDEWQLEVSADDVFYLVVEPDMQRVQIIPLPGFKGSGEVQFRLTDNINPMVTINIPVSVLPSEPDSPQNVLLGLSDNGDMVCSWNPVSHDVSGLPISELSYRIELYSDPDCEVFLAVFTTAESQVIIPETYPRVFVKVMTMNE
jgi:hypothetical protein